MTTKKQKFLEFFRIVCGSVLSDPFVRWVLPVIFIPFLLLAAFDLLNPLVSYLSSLGFSLAGLHVSVLLIIKGILVVICLVGFTGLICKGGISIIDSQKKLNPEVRNLIGKVFQVSLYAIAILLFLDLVGIDLTSVAIVSGAIGIGVGFGLQKIAANFVSGILILFEQNIKVGHLVEIVGQGNPGWIRHLGTRAAIVETSDGRELLVPNEEFLTKTVIDWTFQNRRIRFDLHVTVSFASDLEKAKAIMEEVALKHPRSSTRSPPTCFLEKFVENGARFSLQFWVDDIAEKMYIQDDLLLAIWKNFKREKIEFAPIK